MVLLGCGIRHCEVEIKIVSDFLPYRSLIIPEVKIPYYRGISDFYRLPVLPMLPHVDTWVCPP